MKREEIAQIWQKTRRKKEKEKKTFLELAKGFWRVKKKIESCIVVVKNPINIF